MRASRVFAVAIGVFMLATAMPAAAQAPAAPKAPAPAPMQTGTGLQLGVLGGLSAVQNVGPMAGIQASYAVNDRIQIEAEGLWMKDVVTRARLNSATSLANAMTTSTGKATTATVEAPANYGGVSVRFLIPMDGAVHPYVAVGGGFSKVVYKPAFTLGGTDVTTTLATYGVVLGSDLTGEVTQAAFTGGFGVLVDKSRTSFDVGVRLLSIQTEGQKTNVIRAHIGVAYKF